MRLGAPRLFADAGGEALHLVGAVVACGAGTEGVFEDFFVDGAVPGHAVVLHFGCDEGALGFCGE